MCEESVILLDELNDWKFTSERWDCGLSDDLIENVSIEGFDSS